MEQNTKLFSVISYITWIGWFASYFLSSKDDRVVRQHLNQALVLNLLSTVGSFCSRIGGLFGTIGAIIGLVGLILSIMGIVRGAKGSGEPLPLIGDIRILN